MVKKTTEQLTNRLKSQPTGPSPIPSPKGRGVECPDALYINYGQIISGKAAFIIFNKIAAQQQVTHFTPLPLGEG